MSGENMLKSILRPKESVAMGVAAGVVVYGIYNYNLPSMGQMNATNPHDINIEAARKAAAWEAATVLGIITLLTRDVEVFVIGSAVLIGLDVSARVANSRHPVSGQIVSAAGFGAQGQGYGENNTPGSTARLQAVAS